MSEDPKADQAAPARRSMVFRKKNYAPLPTRDEARRQSAVVQAAWTHFREAAPMIAFLNTRNEALQIQPLALAIESDDGLARVKGLLNDLTRKA